MPYRTTSIFKAKLKTNVKIMIMVKALDMVMAALEIAKLLELIR
jgi:hypothetical protein